MFKPGDEATPWMIMAKNGEPVGRIAGVGVGGKTYEGMGRVPGEQRNSCLLFHLPLVLTVSRSPRVRVLCPQQEDQTVCKRPSPAERIVGPEELLVLHGVTLCAEHVLQPPV